MIHPLIFLFVSDFRMCKKVFVLTRAPQRAKTRISPIKAAASVEARDTLFRMPSL
ncbi:MAG: hypothetical protein JNK03_01710 [Nitrospira sp.]|nr:hypothetical protein [Nitrospira sp.]